MTMKIERIWCDSRVVRSIGYDPVNRILEVEVRGKSYRFLEQYQGPDQDVALCFVAAESKAAFYYAHVFGKFPVLHVDREQGIFKNPPWKCNEQSTRLQHEAALWGYTG